MALEFPDKLTSFTEVDDAQIQPDTHFRYTYEKFQGHGERKCVYAVCTERPDDGNIVCKGYKSTYDPWKLEPDNQYKKFRFYIKHN